MISKESPVDNVEQDEAGGKEPSRDAVDQNRLLAFLLHHVANLLLPLQLDVMHKVADSLLVYHIVGGGAGAAAGWVVRVVGGRGRGRGRG